MKQKSDELGDEQTDGGKDDLSADEIAARIVSQHFGTVPMPFQDTDDPTSDRLPGIPVGDGIIYVSGQYKAACWTDASAAAEKISLARPKQSPELLLRKAQVRLLAEEVLGGRAASMRWKERPIMVTFKGKRPAEIMATLEGCDAVEELLRSFDSD